MYLLHLRAPRHEAAIARRPTCLTPRSGCGRYPEKALLGPRPQRQDAGPRSPAAWCFRPACHGLVPTNSLRSVPRSTHCGPATAVPKMHLAECPQFPLHRLPDLPAASHLGYNISASVQDPPGKGIPQREGGEGTV